MPPPLPAEAAAVALAQALGGHALAAFAALLALVLIGTSLLFAALRRSAPRRADAHPSAQHTLRFGLAAALVLGAVLVFVAIASELVSGDRLARIDQALLDAVGQSTPGWARTVFATVTHLGDPLALWVVAIAGAGALLARGERLLAWGFAAAIGGNALLNPGLKRVFDRIRPLHEGGLPLADGFSFPSGHSSGALVAYGMLAYVMLHTLPSRWHLGAVLFAAAGAFSVGASRVFLQVHFASDVVAGFASGTAWLVTCIVCVEWARSRPR